MSKNRPRNRSAQYDVSCALHLNMFSEKDVERAIKKGVIAASEELELSLA